MTPGSEGPPAGNARKPAESGVPVPVQAYGVSGNVSEDPVVR